MIRTIFRQALICSAFAAFAFVVLYWLFPFVSPITIGQDYGKFWIHNQMNLLVSVKMGSFPLYCPGYAGGGQTSIILPEAQLFHPLTYLMSVLPGYWNGYALEIGTLLFLFFLGLTQGVLFLYLRRLNIASMFAFMISFLVIYSPTMLNIFRHGSAIQNYYMYILLGLCLLRLAEDTKNFFVMLSIIICTYLLVASGHPIYMYFSMIGAGFLTLLAPHWLKGVVANDTAEPMSRYYLKAFVLLGVGVLLASQYWVPFRFEFLSQSSGRVDTSFSWGYNTAYREHLSYWEWFSGVYQPLFGSVFLNIGASPLFSLVYLGLPIAVLLGRKVHGSVWWTWTALTFLFVSILCMPLYFILWKFVPFLKSFSDPSRVLIMAPFLSTLIFVWIVLEPPANVVFRGKKIQIPFYALLSMISIAIYAVGAPLFFWFRQDPQMHGAVMGLNRISWAYAGGVTLMGILALVSLSLHGLLPRWRKPLLVTTLLLMVVPGIMTLRFGTWIATKINAYTHEGFLGLENRIQAKTLTWEHYRKYYKERLDFVGSDGARVQTANMLNYIVHVREGLMGKPLAQMFWKVVPVGGREGAYRGVLSEMPAVSTAYVEGWNGMPDLRPDEPAGLILLTYSSFNRLVFKAETTHAGFLTLSYPAAREWKALLDGKYAAVHVVNGILMGVWVPPGEHQIEFRYVSVPSLVGKALTLGTLFTVLVWCVFCRTRRTLYRAAGVTVAGALVLIWFAAWSYGLYHGKNLETVYFWKCQDRDLRTVAIPRTFFAKRPY